MKRIELVELEGFKTESIIRQVFEVPVAERKISYEKMASIIAILNAVKEVEEGQPLLLEDDQHAILVSTIKEFPFGATTIPLYMILKGIVEAPKYVVPKPALVPKEGEAS